jgi:hypothetical protein
VDGAQPLEYIGCRRALAAVGASAADYLEELARVLTNSIHVRFTPKATQLLRSSGMSRSAGPGYSNT